jgi:lipoyl(octanoyl) transferase
MAETAEMVRAKARVLELGELDYERAWKLQTAMVDRRSDAKIGDTFLFVTHPPTITIGRSAKGDNLLVSGSELKRRGVARFEIERGGDITFHGPGQQVIYPIIDLRSRGRDVHKFLRDLEEVIIQFLRNYDLKGQRIHGKTGVWVGEQKICAIGVAVRRWITFHGLALNLDTDLSFFDLINPCGMPSSSVISLQNLIQTPIDKSKAFYQLINAIQLVFDLDLSL